MKKAISIILAVLMLVTMFPLSAFAMNKYYEGLVYRIINNEIEIVDCNDLINGEVSVPAYINGYQVKSIGDYAFMSCDNIISVNLPDGLESIGAAAFFECRKLESINIPPSVNFIGTNAFYSCNVLSNISLPDSITEIGDGVFTNCNFINDDVLKNILTENITAIGKSAFFDCNEIESIIFPDSILSIGEKAFYDCDNLKNVILPESLININPFTFFCCRNLVSITIPVSVTTISNFAFSDCDNLKTVYYAGTEEQWNSINIGKYNEDLTNANIIFNSSTLPHPNEPEEPNNDIDMKIYSSLPNLIVGKDQEIRFAVSLFEEGTQIESKNGYSVIIKDNAYLETTESYKSGKDQILVFKGKKEGNTKVSFIENDTKIQKNLTIYINDDCRYFRCENENQPGERWISGVCITDFSCSQNNDGTQNIKFNAYNTNYSYATAEVFDQNGTFLKSIAITPKKDDSGMEKVINSFKYVYVDITDHTNPWYKKESNSQHTYVNFENLPKNSIIRITSDGKKSNIVTLYTGIDLFVNVVMFASGIEISKDAQKASVNELVKNILESTPENAIKALASELSTEMLNGSTKESTEKIYTIIYNMFSEIGINYKDILTKVLKGIGYGTLDSIVTTLVPSWKIVTAVDDITAIGWELLSYSSFEYGSGEIKIYIANHGLENMLIENGISVSQNELFSKTTILDAYVVEDSDELKNVYCGAISGVVYNITLRDQGKEIQPNGSIDVRIPIPKDIVGTKCAVYRLESDGTKTEMLTRLDDGYLVFTTDHLSYYEVVSTKHDETNHTPGEWQVTTPAQVGVDGLEQLRCTVCGEILDERVIPALSDPITFTPGDLNDDGKITASDARAALRISAKLEIPTKEQFIAADVNGDDKITASDARIILRVSAKLQTF